jgi:hypothetical protein
MRATTLSNQVTKAKLVSELNQIIKEHKLNDISRDFYRQHSEYPTDAFGKFFSGGWKEFVTTAKFPNQPIKETKVAAAKVEEMPLQQQVELEKEKIKSKDNKWKQKFEHLVKDHEELNREYEAILNVKDKTPQWHEIKAKGTSGTSESVAVMVASDWHAEERVLPGDVSGVNEFNPQIAEKRADKFFQGGQRLWEINSRDTKIGTIVLGLLGDFFSNTLHEDQAESNYMLPADAAYFAQGLIYSGIKFLLKETDSDLLIPCHSGNHGRMTKKQRHTTETGNSLEQYMYYNLRDLLADEPRVKFQIATGYHSYVTVFDKYIMRMHHGHNMKFGGGVGGITIPVNKAIAQWNKTRNVNLDVFGHFHTHLTHTNFVANGSLIGYNAYAVSIKADYEQPVQSFFLVNKKYNAISVAAPIFVGDPVEPK